MSVILSVFLNASLSVSLSVILQQHSQYTLTAVVQQQPEARPL
jgi:hypothetical protein